MEALAHVPEEKGEPAVSREAQLVSDVLRKDRKATAEFVSLCSDWIYPFVRYRLLPRADVVEDLMQEVLISAWKNLPNFRGDAGLRAWVLGIARHKVEDHYRKRIRESQSEDEDTDLKEPAIGSQIQERLEAAADQERVHSTLAQLPEVYGLALIWKYRDGKSLREMGQLTGKTEKAMERLLARARESFRKRWNDGQP
jgi:RNA polymerase sigma-70 factor (ECF subfamily)